MNNLTFQREPSERLIHSSLSRPLTPKLHYNGIHNYETLRLRITVDGGFYQSTLRPTTAASKSSKRYSVSNIQPLMPSSPSPLIVSRYSSIDSYFCPSDYSYLSFPSRHKYVKGKKRPVVVKVSEFVIEEGLSKRLQQQLKIRQQKKKLQTDQKFQRIKEKYLELSKNRKSALKYLQKPRAARTKGLTPQKKNEGVLISPWDNGVQESGF